MRGRQSCLARVLFLSHLCCLAWAEPDVPADEPGLEKTTQTKQEVQSYIDLVRPNDREDRENAYAKSRRKEKSPGWKSR